MLRLVELGDVEGALGLLLAEVARCFPAPARPCRWSGSGRDNPGTHRRLARRAHVVIARCAPTHPGVTDLVLRVGGDGAGRVIIEHLLVGIDRVGEFALLLAGQADVELALRRVGAVGRVLDDALIHLDGAVHRRADRNLPDALRLAGQVKIGDAVLLVQGLLEIVAGGILRAPCFWKAWKAL
jgi:hypothetical protein